MFRKTGGNLITPTHLDHLLEPSMTVAAPTNVCIIIAAKNAADTITRAIASALAEPEAAEVIVIDDGSTDDTARTARAADDGSGRLNVIRFEENRGPAAARNHAIAISQSPLLGVLDADDFFFRVDFASCFQRMAGTSLQTTSRSSTQARRKPPTAGSAVSPQVPACSISSVSSKAISPGAAFAAGRSASSSR